MALLAPMCLLVVPACTVSRSLKLASPRGLSVLADLLPRFRGAELEQCWVTFPFTRHGTSTLAPESFLSAVRGLGPTSVVGYPPFGRPPFTPVCPVTLR